jgi:hypothetical protein
MRRDHRDLPTRPSARPASVVVEAVPQRGEQLLRMASVVRTHALEEPSGLLIGILLVLGVRLERLTLRDQGLPVGVAFRLQAWPCCELSREQPDMAARQSARRTKPMNVANPRSDPPSSARRSLPTPADEDDGLPFRRGRSIPSARGRRGLAGALRRRATWLSLTRPPRGTVTRPADPGPSWPSSRALWAQRLLRVTTG